MATDNEKLYVVTKQAKACDFTNNLVNGPILQVKVFRTRKPARTYAHDKNKKSRRFGYVVHPASWGPSA